MMNICSLPRLLVLILVCVIADLLIGEMVIFHVCPTSIYACLSHMGVVLYLEGKSAQLCRGVSQAYGKRCA